MVINGTRPPFFILPSLSSVSRSYRSTCANATSVHTLKRACAKIGSHFINAAVMFSMSQYSLQFTAVVFSTSQYSHHFAAQCSACHSTVITLQLNIQQVTVQSSLQAVVFSMPSTLITSQLNVQHVTVHSSLHSSMFSMSQ
jgi:hypothetical protein